MRKRSGRLLLSDGRSKSNKVKYRPQLESLEDRLVPAGYLQTNLISDIPGMARFTDPNAVNSWAIYVAYNTLYVTNTGSGKVSAYSDQGRPLQTVTVPPPAGSPSGTISSPTGLVFNYTRGFVISANGRSAPSTLIVATEDGTIAGSNYYVDRNNAVIKVDNSAAGAIYKGLAQGYAPGGTYLYATNFHAGTIDVFNNQFQSVTLSGNFSDPNLPAGYAPFGIRNIGGCLYVTYALQDADKEDDVPGAGNGFVDVFDTSGHLLRRFASGATLNAPWGLAQAPYDFGKFGGALLVGNFGDGRINAFNPRTGAFLGQLTNPSGQPIAIQGLWGLDFNCNTLYFAAGIQDEQHGLVGSLTPKRDSAPYPYPYWSWQYHRWVYPSGWGW